MQEKLFFKNSKGNKLCGILSNQTGIKSKPMAVLCHGFSTSKDSDTYMRLEEALNKKGILTFRFDFFGHGESDGKFENITISEAVDDILNAISFLKGNGYSKIGLFGSSFGGMAALLAAAKTPSLYALALKSPVSDYLGKLTAQESGEKLKDWKKNDFIYYAGSKRGKLKLNYSFFEDAKKHSAYRVAGKIMAPTLIVHGGKDEDVPVGQSKKVSSLIRNCRLEIIQGADHNYSKPEDFEKMLVLVSEFVAENA